MVRKNCYFVKDIKRRRALYLSLVRSQFEHCSPIWRPTTDSMLEKFENFQKSCIKWILSEENLSYGTNLTYIMKCRFVNLLPLKNIFALNDLVLFHKIIYEHIPAKLPSYLSFFSGITRLRSSHLDTLSIVHNIDTRRFNESQLKKSFFFRTHTNWNALPKSIRELPDQTSFRTAVIKHFWSNIREEFCDLHELPEHFDNG